MSPSPHHSAKDAPDGQLPKDAKGWQEELKQHTKEFIEATPEQHVT